MENSIDTHSKENIYLKRGSVSIYGSGGKHQQNASSFYHKQSPYKKSTSRKRKGENNKKKKQNELDSKNHRKELKNFLNEVKSFSPRNVIYKPSSKGSRPGSKMHNSSIRKIQDNSSMATMKYREMFVLSPTTKNNKIVKKSHKKKDNSSKMMKSGSVSNMFHNNSITDSNSKKTMTRQKTSSMLKKIPYSMTNNMMTTACTTSSPTLAMFNSIVSSQRSQKRKKSASRKKIRDTTTPSSYSKFKNAFGDLMMQTPGNPSRSPNAGGRTTDALKNMLNGYKNQTEIHEVGTVNISGCNGKPLMIKVNNESKGLVEYNNFLRTQSKAPLNMETQKEVLKILDQRQKAGNQSSPPWNQELGILKANFEKVLNNYKGVVKELKGREQMLMAKCEYLENQLMKSQGPGERG